MHNVVPHAGTWIEILQHSTHSQGSQVVPHAGTWIEISSDSSSKSMRIRRSPRGNVD